MANYLDAHPEDAECVQSARQSGFVPVVVGGTITHVVNGRTAHEAPVPSDITAEDYAVGLEVLGYRHHAIRQLDGSLMLCLTLPNGGLPEPWEQRASDLLQAFVGKGRGAEIAAFLIERDGEC